MRERLQQAAAARSASGAPHNAIADLIGAIDGLPSDLSARKKHYLKTTSYGRKRP